MQSQFVKVYNQNCSKRYADRVRHRADLFTETMQKHAQNCASDVQKWTPLRPPRIHIKI